MHGRFRESIRKGQYRTETGVATNTNNNNYNNSDTNTTATTTFKLEFVNVA
jgi:hypothetical protein